MIRRLFSQFLLFGFSLLFLVFIVVSCGNDNAKKQKVEASSEWGKASSNQDVQAPDSSESQVITEPLPEPEMSKGVFPEIFESAFKADDQSELTVQVLGKLKVSSGQILVGDPAVMRELSVYNQEFPKGSFPVELSKLQTASIAGVHFLRVRFSNQAVAEWKFGLLNDQRDVSIKDSNAYCFSTKTAMAVVMDANARTAFEQSDPGKLWTHVFADLPEKNGHTGFIYSFKDQNLATCSTGVGKGCYSVYIGYDEEGNVCRLLLDFGMIPWWVEGSSGNA